MINIHAHSVSITALLLLLPLSISASNYVPPPTGPYESSVVINSVEKFSVEQPQVYKFPPADLPDEDYASESGSQPQAFITDSAQYPEAVGAQTVGNAEVPPSYYDESQGAAYGEAIMPPGASPVYDPYQNPWGTSAPNAGQPSYQPGYQAEMWSYPQGNYPAQYPYNYSNRYNRGSNNDYYGMPGPWSMMPNNPFFSGQ